MGYRSLTSSRAVRLSQKERPPKQDKPKTQYAKNVVLRSPITGEFFFARKVKVLSATDFEVVGDKINVTQFIAPYLAPEFRPLNEGKDGE